MKKILSHKNKEFARSSNDSVNYLSSSIVTYNKHTFVKISFFYKNKPLYKNPLLEYSSINEKSKSDKESQRKLRLYLYNKVRGGRGGGSTEI